MNDYYFSVADFNFRVSVPIGIDIDNFLPSFQPFLRRGFILSDCLFCFTVMPASDRKDISGECILEESMNELGYVKLYSVDDGYYIEMSYTRDGAVHGMYVCSNFSNAEAYVCWDDPYISHVCSSMLRIVYSQAILNFDAISVHASVVSCDDGMAYLFMGKSGTGKSTHAAHWTQTFPKCELLNDDNPTVRIKDGKAIVYGTPWSGKTPCYKNLHFPIGGIVRLAQARVNRFVYLADVDAFVALFPGCSLIRQDKRLRNALYDILVRLSSMVTVGKLECLPDKEAVMLCKNKLVIYNKKKKDE